VQIQGLDEIDDAFEVLTLKLYELISGLDRIVDPATFTKSDDVTTKAKREEGHIGSTTVLGRRLETVSVTVRLVWVVCTKATRLLEEEHLREGKDMTR